MNPEVRFKKEIHNNKKLCEFLIKNNAFDNFMKNGINHIKKNKVTDGEVITIARRTINPIIRAFDWDETPEGQNYWYDLFDKYRRK